MWAWSRRDEPAVEQITSQWPLLAGFLALNGIFLRIIQSLYERMVKAAEDDTAEALKAQKDGYEALLAQVRSQLAESREREREWKEAALEQRKAMREAVDLVANSGRG